MNLNKVYNLGIIGFGGMASYHYSELVKYDVRVKPYGVFDLNNERMKAAAERGMKLYDSTQALLEDSNIDIVLVATSNEAHAELCIAALRAGKHVICEKPVTITSDELIKVMEVAKQCKKVFTIDQNRRTNPDFVLMRRCVEQGMIGDAYTFESRVEGSRGMPTGWRTIKSLGGGMMLDWGVHLIDQMMYMLDEPVVSVYCKMMSIDYKDVDDNFRLAITFKSGKLAHIEVSTNNYITHPRWYVLGKNGTLQIDDWSCKGEIVRCIDKDSSWEPEIVYTKAGPTKTMAPRRDSSVERIPLSEPEDVENNLGVVYAQLVAAIEGAPLKITPEQALRVIKVMEAAFESDKTGAAVLTNI